MISFAAQLFDKGRKYLLEVSLERPLQAVDGMMIIILLLGCISFTTVTISPPWDLLGYMAHALNIVNGHGYAYVDGQPVFFRGPVFSLLIALSFKLFGVSPESAFHVIRLFCVANPVLIYLFGKKLFNAEIGFVAALLILSSYSLNYWSYRHLDAVWPFFVILHCYFLYEGFETKKRAFFVLAGLALGVAFLTKEVALLFFPLGSLMYLWIKEYRTTKNLTNIFFCILALMIILLPWIFYLWQHNTLYSLLGKDGPIVLGNMTVEQHNDGELIAKFLEGIKQYGSAIVSFYTDESDNSVTANFILAPLFLLTWLFIICKAFIGDKKSKILVLNICLFLPIIYFIGKNHWRFGQVLHTMLISYLAFSFVLFFLIEWTCKQLDKSKGTVRSAFLFFATVLIVIQVFAVSRFDLGYKQFFEDSQSYRFIKGEKTETKVLWEFSNPYFEKAIEKLNKVSDINDAVLVSFEDIAQIFFLKTGGTRYVHVVPYIECTAKNIENIVTQSYIAKDRAVIMWNFFKPSDPKFVIYLTLEQQLLNFIKENKIKYILLSPAYHVYKRYFSASVNYEKFFVVGPKGRNDENYSLYRVKENPESKDALPVVITKPLRDSLKLMRAEYPEKYRSFQAMFLGDFAGLTPEDLGMIAGESPAEVSNKK